MRLITVDTTRQARSRSFVMNRPDTTGTRADDRAPAATSWKIRSGMRNAAKNASRSALAPNVLPMTTSRT
jgi:ribulose bisphosphate carboxylase small subunit